MKTLLCHAGTAFGMLLAALAASACFQAHRPPPLTPAEQCAQNGLIIGGTRQAQASGVVGKVFAGSGSMHSCQRPETRQHQCEVQAHSQAAVIKQTYRDSASRVLLYANQVRWYTYNRCMGIQQAPPTTQSQAEGAPSSRTQPPQPTPTSQPPGTAEAY